MLLPVEKGVVVPARQAYSHSASVGRRYGFLSLACSFLQNSWQSSHETFSTGRFLSPLKWLGLLPMTACHCSWVTSWIPRKKPLVSVTLCWTSSLLRPSSFSLLPIVKLPGASQMNFMPTAFAKILGGASRL